MKKKTKGSVLYTVISVMIVLFVFVMVTLTLAKAANDRAHNDYSRSQALYSARSIADVISSKLDENGTDPYGVKMLEPGDGVALTVHSGVDGLGDIVDPLDLKTPDIVRVDCVAKDEVGDNFIYGSGENIYRISVAVKFGVGGQIVTYEKIAAPKRANAIGGTSTGGLVSLGTFAGGFFEQAEMAKGSLVAMSVNKAYDGTAQSLSAYIESDDYKNRFAGTTETLQQQYDRYDVQNYSFGDLSGYYDISGYMDKSFLLNLSATSGYGFKLGYNKSFLIDGHFYLSGNMSLMYGPSENNSTGYHFASNNAPLRSYYNLPVFFVKGTFYNNISQLNAATGTNFIQNMRIICGQYIQSVGNYQELTSAGDIYCYENYDATAPIEGEMTGTLKNIAGDTPLSEEYTVGLSEFKKESAAKQSLLIWVNELQSFPLTPGDTGGGNVYSLGKVDIGTPTLVISGTLVAEDGVDISNPANITIERGLFTEPANCSFANGSVVNGVTVGGGGGGAAPPDTTPTYNAATATVNGYVGIAGTVDIGATGYGVTSVTPLPNEGAGAIYNALSWNALSDNTNGNDYTIVLDPYDATSPLPTITITLRLAPDPTPPVIPGTGAVTGENEIFELIKKINAAKGIYVNAYTDTSYTIDEYRTEVASKVKTAFTARSYTPEDMTSLKEYDPSLNGGNGNGYEVAQLMHDYLADAVKIEDYYDTVSRLENGDPKPLTIQYLTNADGSVIKFDANNYVDEAAAAAAAAAVTIQPGDREFYKPVIDPKETFENMLGENGINLADIGTSFDNALDATGNISKNSILSGTLATTDADGIINIEPPAGSSMMFIILSDAVINSPIVINTKDATVNVIIYVMAKDETLGGITSGTGNITFDSTTGISEGAGGFTTLNIKNIAAGAHITDKIKGLSPYFPSVYMYMNGTGTYRSQNMCIRGFIYAPYATLKLNDQHNENTGLVSAYELSDMFDGTGRTFDLIGRNNSDQAIEVVGSMCFGNIENDTAGGTYGGVDNHNLQIFYIDSGDAMVPDPNQAKRPLIPIEGYDFVN